MAAGCHVALVWLGFGNVDDLVEKICFAMLTAEILRALSVGLSALPLGVTNPAEDVVMIGEMRLARLAAVYAASIEVYVVCKSHGGRIQSYEELLE